MCTTIAPRVFELDEAGRLRVLQETVSGSDAALVLDAIACCPVEAIASSEDA